MNRRSFSAAKPAEIAPVEEYAVKLWSLTADYGMGGDYDYGDFPDGIYGFFAPGSVVTVDLTGDSNVLEIYDVTPYVTGTANTVEWIPVGSHIARFTMPDYDVAVEIETSY